MTTADHVRAALARRGRRTVVAGGIGLFALVGCSVAEVALDASDPPPATFEALPRSVEADDDLALLESLPVEPEHTGGYDRSLFPHWDDADGDGCDTRCEVLAEHRRDDGSWFSEWDGATETDPSLVHVDHVVALAEAWRSGAHAWTAAQRDEFADDRPNLLAVTEASNLRKRDHDAATWFPSRFEANCLWARTVVAVKARWGLSVDEAERTALRNLLRSCPG